MKNKISVEDFRTIIRGLSAAYPKDNFIPDEYTFNLWYTTLQDIPYPTLHKASLNYIMTNRYAPSIYDLRAYAQDVNSAIDMLASQAWDKLFKALRYSYAPESEQVWNNLPEITKQCVGGYSTFRAWGNTELSALESVQRPMFVKRFEALQARERKESAVPEGLRKKPLPAIEKMAGTQKAIEADTEKRDAVPAPSDHMKKLRERLGGG